MDEARRWEKGRSSRHRRPFCVLATMRELAVLHASGVRNGVKTLFILFYFFALFGATRAHRSPWVARTRVDAVKGSEVANHE